MFILIIIFFIHFVVGQFLEITKNKFATYLFNGLLLGVVLYFVLGVTDTADTFMYTYYYNHDVEDYDPMFMFLSKTMNAAQYSYLDFYKFHLIVYSLAYMFFITKYTKNYFYVFLVFFVLYYVPFVNQIRYYMAFPFLLLSLHYFLNKRNLFLAILFTFLAVTSHSAVVVLYLFIPMYYFLSTKYFFRVSFISSSLLVVVVFTLFQTGILQGLEHFGEYFSKGNTGSVLGGVFSAIPYVIYIIFLLILEKRYQNRNPGFADDKVYRILSKLSFFTIIFIPSSFISQVIGQRYVFPFIVVWMIFALFLVDKEPKQKKFFIFLLFAIVHILVGFSIYILPHITFGESFYEEELIRSLKSIKYIDYLF